jgi:hypothetical protein
MSDPNVTDPSRAPASARRAAIGFKGATEVLSLRLTEDELGKLREALQARDDSWYEVEATDGAVLVDLSQVSYLRVESGEHRIGF